MPTSDISKFYYKIVCLQMALDNYIWNILNGLLHLTRNLIPPSGFRQLFYGHLRKLAALQILIRILMSSRGIYKLYYEYGYLQMVFGNSTIILIKAICIRHFYLEI